MRLESVKLGQKLRDIREEKDLKQKEVAESTGITNKVLSSYERDVSQPTLDNLKSLCDYYHVSADDLLDIEICQNNTGKNDRALSYEQKRLLQYFDKLDEDGKTAVTGLAIVYYKESNR